MAIGRAVNIRRAAVRKPRRTRAQVQLARDARDARRAARNAKKNAKMDTKQFKLNSGYCNPTKIPAHTRLVCRGMPPGFSFRRDGQGRSGGSWRDWLSKAHSTLKNSKVISHGLRSWGHPNWAAIAERNGYGKSYIKV
jgi:hypothetical protein